jgi:hypothetical protein
MNINTLLAFVLGVSLGLNAALAVVLHQLRKAWPKGSRQAKPVV